MLLVGLQIAVGIFDQVAAIDHGHGRSGHRVETLDQRVLHRHRRVAAGWRRHPVKTAHRRVRLTDERKKRCDERLERLALARTAAPLEQVEQIVAQLHDEHLGPHGRQEVFDLGHRIFQRTVTAPHAIGVLQRNRTLRRRFDCPKTAARLRLGETFQRRPRERMRAAGHVGVHVGHPRRAEQPVEARTESAQRHRIAENQNGIERRPGRREDPGRAQGRGERSRAQQPEKSATGPKHGIAVRWIKQCPRQLL